MLIAVIVLATLIFLLIVATAISMDIAIVRRKKPFNLFGKTGEESQVDTIFKKDITEGQKWILGMPFTEEHITAYDGTPLYGRFYRNGNSKITILMMHGFRSNPIHDFSCAFKFYFDKGFNLCVPDQRAHGKSGGKYITYGTKERFDAKSWMEHINTLVPKGDIYATGVSMGASTVLMAADLELPENVKGIIADCGFTSPAEIIQKVMKEDMKIPLFPLYYTTKAMAKIIAGFDFEECNAAISVQNTKIPILFLHGKKDGFVPFQMGEKIYKATKSKKQAVWVEEADHGCSFLVDHEACASALTGFLGI
ncbi:MAG: alpha/beta hydrolase [Acutalibacteraceae bacterium]|nr:alpha/beta hydrolase [Acutalibacteraceae bacterium]